MADRLFRVPGQGDTPFSYDVSDALHMRPKAVRASFDGSGAGAAFLPCLRLISDSGIIVWEAPIATQVAAGGAADVSWFRGVAPQAATPPPVSGGISWAYIDSNEVARAVGPGLTVRIPALAAKFYTNAPSVFDTALSGGGVQGLRILANGHYAVWMSGGLTSNPAATDTYQILLEGGGTLADFGTEPQAIFTPISGFPPNALLLHGLMSVGGFITPPTDAMVFRFDNFSGATTQHVVYTGLWVMQLDTVNHDL